MDPSPRPPASRAARLVVLATSARVAPGLLSARAWDALRRASQVLTGWPDHPQLPALAEAGIDCRVVADSGPDSLAGLLDQEASAAAPGSVVWLAAPDGWLAGPGARMSAPEGRPGLLDGQHAAGALLAALGALPGGGPEVELLPGSYDLPGARLLDLVATMDTLRVNCPWDAKQTHETLAPHLIEESYEALEALEDGDQAALREELGDVLLQVAFHARVAAERTDGTSYTIDDVADGIVAKLVAPAPACVRHGRGFRRRRGQAELGCRSRPPNGRPRTARPGQPWTACRSASPLWPWPPSCSAARRAPVSPPS